VINSGWIVRVILRIMTRSVTCNRAGVQTENDRIRGQRSEGIVHES
jgi:hypothetical protein